MMILITGGSGCGKSSYAEKLAVSLPMPRYYIATMKPYDEECLKKIHRHRCLRAKKGFETIEQHTDLNTIAVSGGTALLECMCNLTANEMFDDEGNCHDVYDKILKEVLHLKSQLDNLIIVTNDVGNDCREYEPGTMNYITTLGRLNCALAREADVVTEVICGIPITIKQPTAIK